MRPPEPPEVIWHDLECHAYTADLPVWRELAAAERGPVLDVGAGTGRVAIDLAALGHEVVALDTDPVLLAALTERALGEVETVCADAQDFALGREFGLVIVPMQTIQLLGDRPAFFARARAHLRPGGLLAIAIADAMEAFDPTTRGLPLPDVGERDGWRFVSQPVAMLPHGDRMRIDRVRTMWAPDGRRTTEPDRIELAEVTVADLQAEAAVLGFGAEPAWSVPPTAEHVGSTVVRLRG